MQVIEYQHERLALRARAQEARDRIEEHEARALAVVGRRGRQAGQPFAQLGQEARDRRCAGAELRREPLRLGRSDQRAQHLDERPIRRRAARLPAAAPKHARAGLAAEFVREAGLADARLADQEEQPPLALRRLAQTPVERGQLLLAAEEDAHARSLVGSCGSVHRHEVHRILREA